MYNIYKYYKILYRFTIRRFIILLLFLFQMRSLDRLLVLLTTCLNCILSSAEQAYPLTPGRNRSGPYDSQINFPYHVLEEDVYQPANLKQYLSER